MVKTPIGPSFDIATLDLSLWLRGSNISIVTSPSPELIWPSAASAGTSGSPSVHKTTGVGTSITAGALYNGKKSLNVASLTAGNPEIPIYRDGTFSTQSLQSDLIGTTWFMWSLLNITAITSGSGAYTDRAIMLSNGFGDSIMVGGAGNNAAEAQGHINDIASAPITTGLHLIQARRTGSTQVQVRVDSGAWNSVATTAGNLIFNACICGSDYGGSVPGDYLDFGASKTAYDDATADNIKTALNAEYGLAL